MAEKQEAVDYTLNNPDTLTKYKTAAQISEKVLAEVTKLIVPGAKIVEICQKGHQGLLPPHDRLALFLRHPLHSPDHRRV
ncbi:Curved DNA-binding protein like [Verticillium longisporum]|uniref:Curved DNA-binding protein like n=1 Tax=Verticillium longisporum TaxID=100787 RepID=A0A8I2Z5X6_VERLO|nr:Curved DNA-binding protein like [Verticillium longisporum]